MCHLCFCSQLGRNQIEVIESEAFQDVTVTHTFDLTSNQLKTLKARSFLHVSWWVIFALLENKKQGELGSFFATKCISFVILLIIYFLMKYLCSISCVVFMEVWINSSEYLFNFLVWVWWCNVYGYSIKGNAFFLSFIILILVFFVMQLYLIHMLVVRVV